jgi:hypothetical protein
MELIPETKQKSVDYLIRYFGHVIEIKRPDGFPRVVWFDKIVRVQNKEQLENIINTEAAVMIIKQRGMVVMKNQTIGGIQPGDDTSFANRMFVPMEMLAYMDCEIIEITGETPNYEDGITFVGSNLDKKELKAN